MELMCSWDPDETIALAISGGVDSMVLHHLLQEKYEGTYRELILFHVNHGQRDASFEEAGYMERMAEQAQCTLEVLTLDIPAAEFSQELARIKRYQFFDEMMQKHGATVLLTAHHLDDQYETILHALLSGRHLPGGVGIPEAREMPSYRIVRPLLKTTKAEIATYQKKHDVLYFEDETNSETHYTRNYIRHHLMPPIRHADHLGTDHLIRLKDDLEDIDALLKAHAVSFLERHDSVIDRTAFNRERRLVRFYIMRGWLKADGAEPRRRYIEEMIDVIASDVANTSYDMGSFRVVMSYNQLAKRHDAPPARDSLVIEEGGSYSFNGYRITARLEDRDYPIFVRRKREGDRMDVPGTGQKKLSRIFIDRKVPKEERAGMPVVLDRNRQIIALGEIYNIMNTKGKQSRLLIEKEFTNGSEK